ncbi:MAG TPA: hypothetical protein PKW90_25105 [Myxococcota bacterium]|nr:hypothetical protein [Myxococcota bacterium]
MESRRAFLTSTVFGLAVAGLPTVSFAAPTQKEAPTWLLEPVRLGSDLGLGWTLTKMHPPLEGAVTLNLAHADGRLARVALALRDGAPRGPASTDYVDFIVMDGGDGKQQMAEDLGRVVRRLAKIVEQNEAQLPELLAQLEAHADRVWRHPASMEVASTQLQPGAPVAA